MANIYELETGDATFFLEECFNYIGASYCVSAGKSFIFKKVQQTGSNAVDLVLLKTTLTKLSFTCNNVENLRDLFALIARRQRSTHRAMASKNSSAARLKSVFQSNSIVTHFTGTRLGKPGLPGNDHNLLRI